MPDRLNFTPRDGFLNSSDKFSSQPFNFSSRHNTKAPETSEDDAPIQIAVRRRKPAKTAPRPPRAPKMADSDSEGAVKIHFKPKKPTPPTHVKKIQIKVSTTSVVELPPKKPETPPPDTLPTIKLPQKKLEIPPLDVAPVVELPPEEPENPLLDTPPVEDLDLEEVFDAIEQGNTTVFEEFDNPLDHFADAPAQSQPAPIQPEPAPYNSPFISYQVDKRPLSGACPATAPNNFITEKNLGATQFSETVPEEPPRGDLGGLKKLKKSKKVGKPAVTTDIAAAPKKSSTIGLFIAILVTVIAGGFVGALIYFWFFQE